MVFEALTAALLFAALLPFASGRGRLARRRVLATASAAALALFAVAGTFGSAAITPAPTNRPVEVPGSGYTGSSACRACHPAEYASWRNSWHRTMTQVTTPDTAIGDFSIGRLSHEGWHYDLEREADAFWVSFYEPALGGATRRPIVLSTGSHHMQAYWVSLGDDVPDLGLLPFFYLKEDARWVPRDSVFIQPPRPGRPPLDPLRWNLRCVFCHSTGPRPQATPGAVDTEATEFGIACEACHGPGERHVRVNASNPLRRYARHLGEGRDDTIVHPARLDRERSVEVCGQCHGVLVPDSREARIASFETGYAYRPGDALRETGRIVLRGGSHADDPEIVRVRATFTDIDLDASFWPDGMTRVPREYNSLLDTACFQRGEMTCLSCHTLHQPADDPRAPDVWADDQLAPGMRGDAACLQCHAGFAGDVAAHTRHQPESTGSRCQNCHMPYTSYALLKAIRQHQIDAPSAAASVATGRPNACNACHLDRSLGWTAGWLERWYGQPTPSLTDSEREVSAIVTWLLSGDAAQRALAAWYPGWPPARETAGGDWLVPHLGHLLDDPYPAVRYIAWRSLSNAEGFGDLTYDYVGSAHNREEARREVWRRWHDEARPPGGRGALLLLGPDGAVDRAAFAELAARHDDRPVFVAE